MKKRDNFDFGIVNLPFLDSDVPLVFVFLNLFVLLECPDILMTSMSRNQGLIAKLLKEGDRYHKLRKSFSKFYR